MSDSGTRWTSAAVPWATIRPAVLAGAGAEVDEVVGGAHRLLVVLDHDHRVAEVAQPLERRDQLRVVALVQADRGLVEDVEHAHQRGADLRRQADPLRLPAGQRRGGPVHRQVADPDVLEEAQPLGDLAQDQPRDVAVGLGQLDLLEPLAAPGAPTARRSPRCGSRRRAPPATRAAGGRRRTPGRPAATCTPRSSRATTRSRSRGSGAGGSGRSPRSGWRRSAGGRSGCGR